MCTHYILLLFPIFVIVVIAWLIVKRAKNDTNHLQRIMNDMHEELQGKIATIDKLLQMKKNFIANVSHELKTPITSIKGFVETLLNGAINDKEVSLRFLRIVEKQTTLLDNIINDLFLLTKVEHNPDEWKSFFKEESVLNIIEDAIEICANAAEKKSVKIVNTIRETYLIKVHYHLFLQVIINLINNAINYSDENTSIEISASKNSEWISILIKDTGIGIDAEHLPHIFERFYRADKSRNRTLGGSGLGLAIVKHIMDIHNGKVSVSSKINQGSIFVLELPV